MRGLIVGFIALLFLTGCGNMQDVTVKKITRVRLKDLNSKSVTVDVDLIISNPNPVPFHVKNADLLISLNGNRLGKTILSNGFDIPAVSEKEHSITLSAETGDALQEQLPGLLMSALTQSFDVEIEGNIKGGVFIFSKDIPVKHREQVDLKKLNLNGLF